MNETNEQKYMIIKVPLQYTGKLMEDVIEVTGDDGTTAREVEFPHDTKIKGMESALLYWHDGSHCITIKIGGRWFQF